MRKAAPAGLYALVTVGVVAPATAADFKINEDFTVTTNVTVSAGLSVRTENRSSEAIFSGNGAVVGVPGVAQSATQDDGTLNFSKGDIVTAPITVIADAEFNYRDDVGFFIRGKGLYDAALENRGVDFGHAPNNYTPGARLKDSDFNTLAQFAAVTLLDAFAFADVEVADTPISLRAGRQVVSWGESTFIQGGINTINPLDVSAFRRPGTLLKEGLLPIGMLYGNAGVTDNLSLEAFWDFEWQQTQPDGCGTFFSTADILAQGCNELSLASVGAVVGAQALPTVNAGIGQLEAGIAAGNQGIAQLQAGIDAANAAGDTATAAALSAVLAGTEAAVAGAEEQLAGAEALQATLQSLSNDRGAQAAGFYVERGPDRGPKDFDFDNFGISPRYYVDSIDTEFGLYFHRLDSRAPNVSFTSGAPVPVLDGAIPLPPTSFGPAAEASRYNIEYAENINTFGFSAATNIGGYSVAGELSYRNNHPVQINTNDLTLAAISLGNSLPVLGVVNPADALFAGLPPGTPVEGFIRTNQIHGQVSVVGFFDRVLGSDRVTAVGELGFEWLPTLNSDNPLGLNFGRASIYGNPNSSGNDAPGLTSQFSLGWRSRVSATYSNVFAGINVTPSISWNQDIYGYSSDLEFIEGRTQLGFGVSFDYINKYSLALNYTTGFGGTYNGFDDRDFASAVFSVQF
ncbi:DUF1302 domain-containing protein [Rhodobacteraceae bacterium NNCM2]|nr:DUF1302 domain-containing protein [Coraliihabitans acroporae]